MEGQDQPGRDIPARAEHPGAELALQPLPCAASSAHPHGKYVVRWHVSMCQTADRDCPLDPPHYASSLTTQLKLFSGNISNTINFQQ